MDTTSQNEIFYNLINDKKDEVNMGKLHDSEYIEYVSKLIVEEGDKATQVAYELEISYGTDIT